MISYRITTATLALAIAGTILWLLKRSKLHTLHSVWWFGTAAFIVFLGLFPKAFDVLGATLGIRYPPSLALTIAICLILVKVLTMDLERASQEKRIRLLAQRLALLEPDRRADAPFHDDSAPETNAAQPESDLNR